MILRVNNFFWSDHRNSEVNWIRFKFNYLIIHKNSDLVNLFLNDSCHYLSEKIEYIDWTYIR